jgi:PEP-CTERM/exosortase A-associated glycosyltransferase
MPKCRACSERWLSVRILHVLDHSAPLQSGYVFRTLAILAQQRALGWETVQLTTPRQQPGSAVDDVEGWKFHRSACPPSRLDLLPGLRYMREMTATARRLADLLDSFRPDVVHAHSPVLNALPAMRVARRRAIPVVYELRALWEDAAVDHGTMRAGSARYRASRALETYALRRVDHITTICDGLRNEIVARGIPPERITVIPNAVDVATFSIGSQRDELLRKRLGLEESTIVGFAGSFYAYEGLDLLVDALSQLLSRGHDVRALLVGGGPQEQALRARVATRGLIDRVVFTGRIPHADVQRHYDLIDVLAYPRYRMRLTELVTPLKPLEAMAQGRMLVASDVGGHRELIRDGETGFLFAAGDVSALTSAIERVLAARGSWPAIAKRARRFVETERNWTGSVARYASAYGAAVARGARAGSAPALKGS